MSAEICAQAFDRPAGRTGPRNERRFLKPFVHILAGMAWRLAGRSFDRRFGVHTDEVRQPSDLAVTGSNAALGHEYVPTPARNFWLSAGSLRIDPRRFTFVDVGSGMGRILLLAASLPFRRIEGVEFAGELNAVAARNIAAVFPAPEDRARFVLHTLDASEYPIPAGPCLLYLYNPFGAALVERFAEAVAASYRATPRDLYVVYVNPFHRDAFERRGFEPVRAPWYAAHIDRRAPHPFAIYRLH